MDPVDETYFESARYREVLRLRLRAPADEVWTGLTAERPLTWCRRLTDVHYTSPAPYGVGTTRTAVVGWGALKLHERFFVWDDDARHHSFLVESANLPLFRAFAEDYQVEPEGSGSLFTWTFAFDPRPGAGAVVAAGAPASRRLLFGSFGRDTLRHFGERASG